MLFRSLSEKDLDKTDSEGWSPRQVIHHMADSEAQSYARLRRLIAEPGTTIQGYDEGKWAEDPTLGYKSEDMSVMFRLPSETHGIFNDFVKFHELNSPIRKNTRVVFVSQKIPKTILKSKIQFHSILNLGYSNIHYTLKNFIKTHENRITYSKITQKTLFEI